jgi:ATP-dependent Lon protease
MARDGAGLGIPMFAAVASLLLDVPTRAEVAAVGEITLRGSVLPVEGIKDKILAAHRAGIREVVLPAKNERDIEEVPKEILEDIQLRFVNRADEVLRWMLERPPTENPRTLTRPSEPPTGEMHP